MSSLSIHSSYIRYYTEFGKALTPYMTNNSSVNQRLMLFGLCVTLTGLLLAQPSYAVEANEGSSLSWYPRAQLTPEEQDQLMQFCRGAYRIPQIESFDNDRIETEADQTKISSNGEAIFTGSVVMQQHDQILRSDYAKWNQNTSQGELSGQVSLTSPLIVLNGESADIDEAQGLARFRNAQYSLPANHMRGTANYIQSLESGYLDLEGATLTFCEPGNTDWDIATSKLHIDQNKQMGSAWHTRLRVAEIPVFYFPYYYFPIGDQRMTGFLDPSLSFTGSLQAKDIQLPFYWNIAPNYDATITPHYVRDHGVAIENQFRHKTRLLGDGEFNYHILSSDETTDEKRWLINYEQKDSLANGWQHRWEYNQVSDDEYLNDLSPTDSTDRTTHLPRRGEILWDKNDWHFDVTAEAFQTIDSTIALQSRPYGRLPQFNLSYMPQVYNKLQFQQQVQATRFSRNDAATINEVKTTLTGFNALNGDRLLSDTSIAYPMEWPFGFLKPEVEYRVRSYTLRDADAALLANQNAPETNVTISSPRYSLDAGLYFDREFEWFDSDYTQTLEPRVFWVNSPLVKYQNEIPNFDSGELTVTHSSLFMGDRFSGGDRLADLNQVSIGLTSRFIREDGLEQFRVSVGQIFYNDDRIVQLAGGLRDRTAEFEPPLKDTYDRSGLIAEVEWTPNERWSTMATVEWDEYQHFARQQRFSIRYENQYNQMFNLARNTVRTYNDRKEEVKVDTDQADAGFFWSLNDRWAFYARALVDLRDYEKADPITGTPAEARPLSSMLESLAGFEYQTCCWRFQLSYRETSDIQRNIVQVQGLEHEYTTKKNYGVLFSIQLKGFGNIGKSIDKLMDEDIQGYSRRKYHDF